VLALAVHSGIYAGDYARGWLAEQLGGCGVRSFADLRCDDPGSVPPPSATTAWSSWPPI
jgi:NTE family protein